MVLDDSSPTLDRLDRSIQLFTTDGWQPRTLYYILLFPVGKVNCNIKSPFQRS
jgi:hypothetical protein